MDELSATLISSGIGYGLGPVFQNHLCYANDSLLYYLPTECNNNYLT